MKMKEIFSLVNYNKYKYQINEIEEGENKEIHNITRSFKVKLPDYLNVMNNLSKDDIFLDKVKKNSTLDNVDQSLNFDLNILESSFLKDKFESFKSVKLHK